MRPQDIEYHVRREAQERVVAAAAIDPTNRRIHLELAERHAARVRQAHASFDPPDDPTSAMSEVEY